jgi:CRISPR system Cascade subunit CasE
VFFSRILLKPDNDRAALVADMCDQYGVHRVAWSFFPGGPDADRDFLYRFEAGDRLSPRFFVVSPLKPRDESGAWDVRTKLYEPKLAVGDRLEFAVRVNPVVTRHDEQGKQKRCDVVMDAKTALKKAGKDKTEWPAPGDLWREAVGNWLRARSGKHGFDFADAEIGVEGYMPARLWSRKQQDPIRISTVELSGVLTVTDPVAFRSLLFHGLGPAKGFGCGLMLVKRARA